MEEEAEDEEGEFEVICMGLSFNAYDNDVREIFDECGNILNLKLLMRPDGKSKGTAFIKFSSKNSFNKALELNGMEHMGRTLKVEEAQNKSKGPEQQQNRFNNNENRRNFNQNNRSEAPGTAVIETPTLFIGQLSYGSTVDSIKGFFASVGAVQSARIVTDKETGKV